MIDLSTQSKLVIEAYDKGYRVSEVGDVISPFSSIPLKNQLRSYKCGYKIYRFTIRSVVCNFSRSIPIHKLTAYQKYGLEAFKHSIEIRHLDGNSLNNSPSNIAIGMPHDNAMDKQHEVRKRVAISAATKVRKFTDKDVNEIRKFHKGSYKETMEAFNISSKGSLHYILNNNYKTKI